MKHESTQAQILYILKGIDYSKSWWDVEKELSYTLGDHRFESDETYKLVVLAAKSLWDTLHGWVDSTGNVLN